MEATWRPCGASEDVALDAVGIGEPAVTKAEGWISTSSLSARISALADAGEPLDWAVTLLAARVGRMRTTALAGLTDRSTPAARAERRRMTRAGWLEPRGATRGRCNAPSERFEVIPLRVPGLMRLLAAGEQLVLFDEELSR